MWGSGCVEDVFPAAVALINQTSSDEFVDHRVIAFAVLRLPLWLPIPGEADRRHIVQLAKGDVPVAAVVEILDSDQEPPSAGTGEKPCQHRCAHIADM
jgi:hypothetical protein